MQEEFLVGTGLVLLGHFWLIPKVGFGLAGRALFVLLGMWLLSTLLGLVIPESTEVRSLMLALLIVTIFVCIEDFTRTWFLVSSVRKRASYRIASAAFAIVASILETVQIWRLIVSAMYKCLGIQFTDDVPSFTKIFSSYSLVGAIVCFNIVRPFFQYYLCILLFRLYEQRKFGLYAAVIGLHAMFDFILELQYRSASLSYPIYNLMTALVFVSALGLADSFLRRSVPLTR